MSELMQKIEALIVEAHRLGDKHPDDYNEIIGDYARRIAALPQQITTETVRKVIDAQDAVHMGMRRGEGRPFTEDAYCEAIAQRVNVEQEK